MRPQLGSRGAAIVSVALGLTLAACSGPDPAGEQSDSGQAEGETVTLQFAAVPDPSGAEAFYRAELDRFTEENPNIQVELIMHPAPQYPNAIELSFQDGNPPDAFRLVPRNRLHERAKQNDWLLPLDDYITEDLVERFPEDAFDPALSNLRSGDEIVALPFAHRAWQNTKVLLYNPALLEEYGFDSPPEDWSEVAEYASEITEAGNGEVFGFSLMGQLPDFGAVVPEFTAVAGPTSVADIGIDYRTGQAAMADGALVEVVHWLRDLNAAGALTPGWESWQPEQMMAEFARERLAMMVVPPWFFGEIEKLNPDVELGIAPIPVPDGGREAYQTGGSTFPYLGIASSTEHPDEAWKLLDFLSSSEHHKRYYEEFKLATSMESAWMGEADEPTLRTLEIANETIKPAPDPSLGSPAAQELVNRIRNEVGVPWHEAAAETILRNDDFAAKAEQLDAELEQVIETAIAEMNAEGTWGEVSRDLITYPDWDPAEGFDGEN